MTKRGSLILIEGLDRTGKSTQASLLISKFQSTNAKVKTYKFPERSTPIGKLINSYLVDKQFQLSDETAHLLFSANRWELLDTIKQDLLQGYNVILDRYVYSGVAYSSAKGLDFEWCFAPDRGLPRPDLTIFLTLEDDKEIVNREGYGEERYEVKSFQDKVKLQYKNFVNEPGWKEIKVDGKGIEQVEKEVWEIVSDFTEGVDGDINIL